ncbi:MAG TPA: hypothetical protein VMA37_03625 [Acetobacteraceae bacterium]|nr:hypothetical protein [Acetobacteraceae bacterium]
MPTYEDLRAYFDQSETLQSVARQAAAVQIVTGFTIDVHPLWILLYDLEEGAFGADFPSKAWIDRFVHFFPVLPTWPFPDWPVPAFQSYRRRDLKRQVALWPEFSRWFRKTGAGSPIMLTIVHRPICTPISDEPNNDEADRARLIEIANASPAFVQVEERPQATLAFAPGDGIKTSQGRSGTYGGTLTDQSGNKYGMSCAHVAATGDPISDNAGAHLGMCTHHTTLSALGAGTVCDPLILPMPVPSPGNGSSVNMLDLSLIDLTAAPASARTLSGVAKSLTIGQDVEVDGAITKTKCRLGSLAISYAFTRGGKSYCFRDSVELKPRSKWGIGGALGTLLSTLPTQGDSGAWVLTQDAPPAWAGVFFAEDGQRGYCIRAKWAHDWAENLVGTLSV